MLRRQWATKEKALGDLAAMLEKHIKLGRRFDTFGNNPQSQAFRHGQNGTHYGFIGGVIIDMSNEAPVDLKGIDRQSLR